MNIVISQDSPDDSNQININAIKLNKHIIDDLEIRTKIFPKVNKTITMFGNNVLYSRLSYISVTNLDQLIDVNRYLYSNNTYREKLETKLNQIKELEHIYDIWDSHWHHDEFIHGNKYLDNSTTLNITNKIKFSNVMISFVMYIIMYYFYKYMGMTISPTEYISQMYTGTKIFIEFLISLLIKNEKILHFIGTCLTILYVCFQVYSIYEMIMNSINHYHKCNQFKEYYYDIINLIKHCKFIFDHDIFKENLQTNEKEILTSFKNLDEHFKSDNSLGEILVEAINYKEYRHDLDIILEYIGTIDMMISNTKLLDLGFCLPNIDKNYNKPYIKINKVWNPLLGETQTKNNFRLGLKKSQNMIITGPNKAGKSTYIRSVMLAVYLAQSLGISCCEKIYFTPFSQLYTYLNIPDCLGKESLFEAELERCFEYFNNAIQTNKDHKIFGIFDELMTGTNYLEGMSGSYGLIKELSKIQHAMSIITTHYHEICDLKNIKYQQFEADKIDNKYKFSYIIKNGISKQCIALDLLEEKGYSKEIIEHAKNKLKKFI